MAAFLSTAGEKVKEKKKNGKSARKKITRAAQKTIVGEQKTGKTTGQVKLA